MIEVKGLNMTFGSRRVLRDLSFTAPDGNVTAFLGPNGAGKSTTMRVIAGYLVATSGAVRINGFDVETQRRLAQQQLGYVPEAAAGFGSLTPAELLSYLAQVRGLAHAERGAAIGRVCELMDLRAEQHRRINHLSKGWRQRVWVAQALLHDPAVLVMDEPTDGLDPIQKRQTRELIRQLRVDRTILLSTHILEEAEEVSDRTIVIADGRVLVQDETSNLLDESGRIAATFHRLIDSDCRPVS
ncbi:MAG: ATP-binding cassette domain-containing protein [Gammaproteobacteria bacterium]|nr:ATP-binding cassette domain-containing protein [Gammaproteobacteria bacterium]